MIVSTITDAGRGAIAAAVAGEKLTFSRFAIGDGALAADETEAGKTALTSEVLSLGISEFTDNGDGTVTIGGFFTSADMERAFFFRELGLYATVGDNADPVLIVYGNAGNGAEYITEATAEQSGEFVEKGVRLRLEINAANVTATIDPEVLATKKYVNEKTAPLSTLVPDVETLKETVLTTDNITNCFLSLPRNEYTLENGVLTFKAGSKFFKPDGSEIVTDKDLSVNLSSTSEPCLCWLRFEDPSAPYLQGYGARACFVGTTAEREAYTGPGFWYDTSLAKFFYHDKGVDWLEINMTFPAAVAEVEDSAVKSVKTFDGIGFFGSLLFVTPGIKGLAPNGRDKTGAFINHAVELNTLETFRAGSDANGSYALYVNYNGRPGSAPLVYNAAENKNYGTDGSFFLSILAGRITFNAGRIVSFEPKAIYSPAYDTDVLHKGDILTEDLLISTRKKYNGVYIRCENLSTHETPEDLKEVLIGQLAKDGTATGGVYTNKAADGYQRTMLFSRNKELVAVLGIEVGPDGTIITQAPTPPAHAVGKEIVTALWVKENAGFAFPGTYYINLDYDFTTAGEHTEVKTAPANGYFLLRGRNTTENVIIGLRFENMDEGLSNHKYGPAGYFVDVFLPVKAGQKIVVFRSAAVTEDAALRFYYAG